MCCVIFYPEVCACLDFAAFVQKETIIVDPFGLTVIVEIHFLNFLAERESLRSDLLNGKDTAVKTIVE